MTPFPSLMQVCSTRDVHCSYEGCQPGCSYSARLRVVGEDPVTYGRFTDPVQFSVPPLPAGPVPEEDQPLPRAAGSPESRSTSRAVTTLRTLMPQKCLAPCLFALLSGLVVLLAFAMGVFFEF